MDLIFYQVIKELQILLDSELKNSEIEITNATDPGIFKNDFEKIYIKDKWN